MFCTKCGTKLPDDAVFCTKCGEKLTAAEVKAPSADTAEGKTGTTGPANKADGTKPKAKRSRKIVIGLIAAAAVVLIVLLIAAIVDDGEDEPSLYDLAESVAPMTEFGYDATYRDFFDWLIENEERSLEQEGGNAYLTYSGNVTGGDQPVSIVLEITGLDGKAEDQRLYAYSMTLNGKEVDDFGPSGMLNELFWGQKNRADYPRFMDLVNWSSENGITTYDKYFGLDSQSNMFSGSVASVEDAREIVDGWLAEHPVGPMAEARPEDEASIPDYVAEMQYSFELWEEPQSFLGLIYVRKLDGYLTFTSSHGDPLYDLDEWYENVYLSQNISSSVTPEQASELAENWVSGSAYEIVDPVDESEVPASVSQNYYVFSYWGDPRTLLGYLYVDRTDGSLYFLQDLGGTLHDTATWEDAGADFGS